MHEPMGGIMQDRWMTLQEVAEYLQLSKDQIYRINSIKWGSDVVVLQVS